MREEEIPDGFRKIFHDLVQRIQPRPLPPNSLNAYWAALQSLPLDAIRQGGLRFQHDRFFPSPAEWVESAKYMATWQAPAAGSRKLEELDDYAPNDPERDEISKGLSDDEGDELMTNYGYVKVGRNWVHQDDLPKAKP